VRVAEPRLAPRAIETTIAFVPAKGRVKRFTLRYRYDRAVVGNGWRAANHARVLAATPAVNYALFAKRLVLDYAVTKEDRAWIERAIAVTAREQVLNRFATESPHPLILPEYHTPVGDFVPAMVERTARLVAGRDRAPRGEAAPASDPGRFAVLSSGGKESLLTYGLLRELGREVHPVFVNESGRHWHTALTSWRHLSAADPRARRVWTDVDRLYVGANRILPCVRPDFQRVAADVYPTQLWTFSNYQLAALPVLWADGAGTLAMGNEYDEGPWPEVKGVRHWHGIHDQSVEFDAAASEYYVRKAWGVAQTSLVRPLTCYAIQGLLGTRYPDLFETQTSCHATTIRRDARGDTTVVPCGRCSKCLGVLLFLGANGLDATRIRYRSEDVGALAARVGDTRLKLDEGEAEHALASLVARGWRFEGSANGFEPRRHRGAVALHERGWRPPRGIGAGLRRIFREGLSAGRR